MALGKKKSLKNKIFSDTPSTSSKMLVIVVMVCAVVVAIALASYVFVDKRQDKDVLETTYQAVFLNNGQVYFGKLSRVNGSYVVLSDIYYPQVAEDTQKDKKDKKAETQLNKFSSQVYGPENQMFIPRENISHWENLKSDSKVVEAIESQDK